MRQSLIIFSICVCLLACINVVSADLCLNTTGSVSGYGSDGICSTGCYIKFFNTPNSLCVKCLKGSFCPVPNLVQEIPCPTGTFSTGLGSTSCTACNSTGISISSGALVYTTPTATLTGGATGSVSCLPCAGGQYYSPVMSTSVSYVTTTSSAPSNCSSCTTITTHVTTPTFICNGCEPGFYSDHYDATACTSADPGYETNNINLSGPNTDGATEESACNSGEFNPFRAQPSCFQVPAGFEPVFSSDPNNNAGSTDVIPCNNGTYNPDISEDTGMFTCTECPANFYCIPFGPVSFTIQDYQNTSHVNTYSGGISSPTPCPAGTYSLAGSNSILECLACPAGQYSVSGGSCTPCNPGSYSASNSSSCTPCPSGSATPNYNSTSCPPCLAGSYQPNTGATSCIPASCGNYVPMNGSNIDDICATGTFNPFTGSSTCFPPSPGFIVDPTNACAEIPCNNGTYASSATTCSPCPAGDYCPSTGTTPSTNFTNPNNVTSPPYVGPGSGNPSPTPCPGGYYQNATGQTSCLGTPCGTYTPSLSVGATVGATSPSACPSGTFNPFIDQSACFPINSGFITTSDSCGLIPCNNGTYSNYGLNTQTPTACTPCPAGDYCPVTGPANETVTNPVTNTTYPSTGGVATPTGCPCGSFSGPGASSCISCNGTQYQNASSSTGCITLTAGFIQDLPGLCNQIPCNNGTYALGGVCVPCPAGSYTPQFPANAGYTACIPSTPGSDVPGPDENAQVPCGPGTIQSLSNSSSCVTCPAGTYSTGTLSAGGIITFNATYCIACPAGQYSTAPGSSSCTSCLPGSYSPLTGASACLPADEDYYVNTTGSSTETLCPRVSNPAPCPPGLYPSVCSSPQLLYSPDLLFSTVTAGTNGTIINGTTILGSNSSASCVLCPNGTFALSGSGNTTYSVTYYNQTCLTAQGDNYGICTITTSVVVAKGPQCKPVPIGSGLNCVSGVGCVPGPCPNGTFADGLGNCLFCAPGTYSLGNVSVCTNCPSGTSAPNFGSSVCLSCNPGSYSNGNVNVYTAVGAFIPVPPVNAQNVVTGNTIDVFGNLVTQTSYTVPVPTCLPCPCGTFSGAYESTVCTNCPSGTSTNGFSNSTSCTNCPSGTSATNLKTIMLPGTPNLLLSEIQVDNLLALPSTNQQFVSLVVTNSTTNTTTITLQVPTCQCTACAPGLYSNNIMIVIDVSTNVPADVNCILNGVNCDQTSIPMYIPGAQNLNNITLGTDVGNDTIQEIIYTIPTSMCDLCPMGTYAPATNATLCIPCNNGTYGATNPLTSISVCLPCPVGSYSSNIKTVTLTNNDFLDIYGNGITFSSFLYGPIVSVIPDPADPLNSVIVTYLNNNATPQCTPCPLDTYASVTGAGQCTPCANNTYAPVGSSNSSACIPCLGNSVPSSPDHSICLPCLGNTFANYTTVPPTCQPCPFPQVANTNGTVGCSLCLGGQYPAIINVDTGLYGCAPCPAGSTSSPGDLLCTPCPVNTYQVGNTCLNCTALLPFSPAGSISLANCTGCATGSVIDLLVTGGCSVCTPGTYQFNATTCLPCPLGTASNVTGATVCPPCTPGTIATFLPGISVILGALQCTPCPSNTYQLGNVCLNCTALFPFSLPGSTGLASCTGCPAGQIVSGLTCTPCTPGLYQVNATTCSPCPLGYTSVAGATVCNLCANGYTPITGGVCIPCAAGSSSTGGACTPCPLGYTSVPGGLCILCSPGYYQFNGTCVPCAAGTASNGINVDVCPPCASGTASNVTGATVCPPCAPGSISTLISGALVGPLQCTPCIANTYQVGNACSNCPGSQVSPVGSVSLGNCTCPVGTTLTSGACIPNVVCPALAIYNNNTNLCVCPSPLIPSPSLPIGVIANVTGCVCPIGSHFNTNGSCVPCDPFYYTLTANVTGNCTLCGAGRAFVNSSTCTVCPAGEYSPEPRIGFNHTCRNCSAGTVAKHPGSEHCTACEEGYFQHQAGRAHCDACPANTYWVECDRYVHANSTSNTTLYQCPARYREATRYGCTPYCRVASTVTNDDSNTDTDDEDSPRHHHHHHDNEESLVPCSSPLAGKFYDEDGEFYYMCPHQRLTFCVDCPKGLVSYTASTCIGDCKPRQHHCTCNESEGNCDRSQCNEHCDSHNKDCGEGRHRHHSEADSDSD
jgi:hypothetical protein